MRIVGGRLRGRRLVAPEGYDVRPTGDRVRESLFNLLERGRITRGEGSLLPGRRVLDGFAGSGALGLEALSRGASHVTFMEHRPEALAAIETNVRACRALEEAMILRADCLSPPKAPAACEIVLLDPPYGRDLAASALAALNRQGWIAAGAVSAVEVGGSDAFEPPAGFTPIDERRYGRTRMILLRKDGS